jgi:DHA1 family tetracycline resistance protein-like MFS transporter
MGSLGALLYALAWKGWMIFPIAVIAAVDAVTYPSLNAMMTRPAPPDQQGELQGAIASLASLASIVGPFLMTRTFGHFSAPGARPYFPGAAFALTALLDATGLVCLLLIARSGRRAAAVSARA